MGKKRFRKQRRCGPVTTPRVIVDSSAIGLANIAPEDSSAPQTKPKRRRGFSESTLRGRET